MELLFQASFNLAFPFNPRPNNCPKVASHRLSGIEVAAGLAHCVRRALEPMAAVRCLLGCEDLDEPLAELVEAIGQSDVTVQRCRVELRQDQDSTKLGMQAAADRNIDEPVLAANRDGRFRAGMCQRKQSSTAASAEDDRQDVAHAGKLSKIADCGLRIGDWGLGIGLLP